MNLSYVSQGPVWSMAMQSAVQDRIVDPVARRLGTSDFDLSLHLQGQEGQEAIVLWAILQTPDHSNEVVRCEGLEFNALVEEVQDGLRSRLARSRRRRRRVFADLFKNAPLTGFA